MHQHHQVPINRLDWEYWVDGADAWSTRWDCMQGDWVLALAQVIAMSLMAYQYVLYAVHCDKAFGMLPDSPARSHALQSKIVFIQCVMIHILTSIVAWFWTPNYLIVVLILYNTLQTKRLNDSKVQMLHAQEIEINLKNREAAMAAYDVLTDEELTTVDRLDIAKGLLESCHRRGQG